MSGTTSTIFFIAGATRGLGLAFVDDIASKYPSAIVYAGARDPSSPGASALKNVAAKYPGRVEIVKYVSADEEGNKAVAKEIGDKHGHVDVVIANAAICSGLAPVHELDTDLYKEHFTINVAGPVVLFQAFYPLLKASTSPKFIPISSSGGSITLAPPVPLESACYCSTKTALNWIARKIHFENEWLVCFPLDPGVVDTDMFASSLAADKTGTLSGMIAQVGSARSPAAAARALVDIIVSATRESEGGQYVTVDGSKLPW